MSTQPQVSEEEFLRRAKELYEKQVKNRPAEGQQLDEGVGEPPPAPAITLDWQGETREFSTQAELATFMQAEVEKARRATLEEVTRQMPGQYVNPNAPPPVPQTPKIDVQELAKRMEKDPVDAWNYVDEVRFGVKDVPGVIREMAQRIAAQDQYLAVTQFRADHPEYQTTPENGQTLIGLLQANNLPLTAENLELVYTYGRQKGIIQVQDNTQDNAGFGALATPPAPHAPAGPPRLGRTANNAPAFDLLSPAESMSSEELERYISSLEGRR